MNHKVEIGRFGRFRDRMVSVADIVAVHTLQEMYSPRAKSLIFDRNHGAWEGTGTTRGVSIDVVLEGELGATFDGNGRVRVPNDGDGFLMDGDGAARTLSLGDGHADLFGVIRTTHNSATLRCLVHKQDGGASTGNGIRVAYQNGQLRGYMKRAGSVIVDFARDLPMDGRWHVWQLHMSGLGNRARLILDGYQLGAEVTCSAEPPLTSGDYCIGGFSDLSGGFIGSLGLIGCSRAGNPDICAALTACLTRTPITVDIRTETSPLDARHGFVDDATDQAVAPPGVMGFVLDNSPLNADGLQGRYTVGHENSLTGLKEGNPVLWTVTDDDGVDHVRFVGFVSDMEPEPGLARMQQVPVECETWMARAMRATVRQLPVCANIRSDDALRYIIDQVDRPPRAIDFAVGDSTFPFVFDDVQPGVKVYDLLARVVRNEGGLLYEQPDGTLVFESRTQRYIPGSPAAFWNDTNLEDLIANRGTRDLVNVIPYTITPRRVGAVTTDVLASMPDRIMVTRGDAPTQIELTYRDPDNPTAAIAGTEVTVPVATTDYTATADEDGGGGDRTSSATITAPAEDIGATSIKLTIENTGSSQPIWVKVHQVRGRKLQRLDDRTVEVRDDASVFENDEMPDPLRFEYQTNQEEAGAIAGQRLALRSQPYMAPRVAYRRGADDEMQQDIVERVLGEEVSIAESMTGLDGSQRMFIQGVEVSVGSDGVLKADYHVTRAQAAIGFFILDEVGHAELDDTTVLA